jgi:hypothetical protein
MWTSFMLCTDRLTEEQQFNTIILQKFEDDCVENSMF